MRHRIVCTDSKAPREENPTYDWKMDLGAVSGQPCVLVRRTDSDAGPGRGVWFVYLQLGTDGLWHPVRGVPASIFAPRGLSSSKISASSVFA